MGNPLPESIADLVVTGGDMFFMYGVCTFKSFQLSTRRGPRGQGGDSRHRVTDSRSEKVYFPFLEETLSSSTYEMDRAAAPQVGNLSVKELEVGAGRRGVSVIAPRIWWCSCLVAVFSICDSRLRVCFFYLLSSLCFCFCCAALCCTDCIALLAGRL